MKLDMLAPETFDENMFERLKWLRENEPLHREEANGLWVVTRYEDVSYVSKNPKIFCSGKGVRPNAPIQISIIDMDEPRHGQLRKMINKGFTPRMVRKLEVYFRDLTHNAIDRVLERGEFDFVKDISVPLPLELIAEMIGIPKEDRDTFHRWSDALIRGEGNLDKPEIALAAAQAFAEYSEYLQAHFAECRREPRDDLVSILVRAFDEGLLGQSDLEPGADQLGDPDNHEMVALARNELLMFMVLLLVAGNETTRNAMSGGMSALIENPDERRKLIQDPSLVPSAVEEIVRYVSPVISFARTATRDTELRGQKIREGEKILMIYPAANRDPRVFAEPDRFLVDRRPNNHVGFGVGNHFCLGANLARMELRVMLHEVLTRLPELEYAAGPPKMIASPLVRNFSAMAVRPSKSRVAA